MCDRDDHWMAIIMKFHHIGYAVASIPSYFDEFMAPLFAPVSVSETFADPIQQVRVCFVQMQGGTVIELVEPLGEKSPIHAYIGSKRGGIYHVCYEVANLDASVAAMRARKCMPLGKPVPATAFGGRRIVFMLTPQRDLVELLEAQAPVVTRPAFPA
jgi:methylmalonyl-CoA/ethylmalonyl-CoA epimerase